jgi:hypothetical protein
MFREMIMQEVFHMKASVPCDHEITTMRYRMAASPRVVRQPLQELTIVLAAEQPSLDRK